MHDGYVYRKGVRVNHANSSLKGICVSNSREWDLEIYISVLWDTGKVDDSINVRDLSLAAPDPMNTEEIHFAQEVHVALMGYPTMSYGELLAVVRKLYQRSGHMIKMIEEGQSDHVRSDH